MRRALRPPVAAVVALALLAPAAAAQDPVAGLEDIAVEAAIPQDSVISEQYPDVAAVVDEAVEAVPATPPPPVPQESPEQYHSETPDVSVTQQQPSNVNVSIRINSPGDDGPVVQINGNANVVDVVQAPAKPRAGRPERPPAPDRPEDGAPAAGMPSDWEWVWTSACFGGAGHAAAAAAADPGGTPGWTWRWSCDQADVVAEGVTDTVEDFISGAVPTTPAVAEALIDDDRPAAAAPRAPSPRGREGAGARRVAPGRAQAPRPAASPVAPLARPLVAAVASARGPAAVAARAAGAVRHAVRAQARTGGRGAPLFFPPGAGGPVAGAASGLGTASALAFGAWIAVLMSAIVFVLPRLRPRRWSGPSRRPPRPRSSRLERPG